MEKHSIGRATKMKMTGWAWDHAKNVADRCAERFKSRTEIERYLLSIGWSVDEIEQMLAYLDRKEKER